MNKNRSNKRDAIDWIEFNNDATKFDNDLQYLKKLKIIKKIDIECIILPGDFEYPQQSHTT